MDKFGITTATLMRWRDNGLPHGTVGTMKVVKESDLKARIEKEKLVVPRYEGSNDAFGYLTDGAIRKPKLSLWCGAHLSRCARLHSSLPRFRVRFRKSSIQ